MKRSHELWLSSWTTHYEAKVKQHTPYLPLFSAAVLIIMGLGFITGLY
jgi:nickel/cobalt exporter